MTDRAVTSRHWMIPILGLLVVVFAICTSELVVAGLLPTLATDLAVDIPTAGLLITGYAIGVAIAGPVLSLLTGRLSRKTVLLGILCVFLVGNALCALAPDYWTLLGARLIISACHGLFFGVALVVATRLAPPDRKSTAASLVIAGVTAAIIAGVPLGTAIGNAYGWRTTYWLISGVGLLAMAGIAWLIPSTLGREAEAASDPKAELRAAVRPVVVLCYTIFGLALVGFFAMQSYIVPFLTHGGVPLEIVPIVLFLSGIASFFGTLLGGRLGDRYPVLTMSGAATINVILLILLGQLAANGWGASVVFCVGMFFGFMMPGPLQSRLLREASDAPNLASTLMNTASQIGIACGAAIGGLVIAWGWGYGQLPFVSALFQALALSGLLVLIAYDRRRKPSLA